MLDKDPKRNIEEALNGLAKAAAGLAFLAILVAIIGAIFQ